MHSALSPLAPCLLCVHSPHFALPPAVFRARIHAGLTFASAEYKQSAPAVPAVPAARARAFAYRAIALFPHAIMSGDAPVDIDSIITRLLEGAAPRSRSLRHANTNTHVL